MKTGTKEAIKATQIGFAYPNGETLFDRLDLTIESGTILCVTGRSGLGKSTLLYCLAGVLQAQGTITIGGSALTDDPAQRARLRLHRCGFIFQRGELLPELDVVENVALPLRLTGTAPKPARTTAARMLDSFGIGKCAQRTPDEISGGQAQRASVARALIHSPAAIFADEPTASLDSLNRSVVINALRNAAAGGAAIVCATHDQDLMNAADNIFDLGAAINH